MFQGEVWWADMDEPTGSAPGFRRPVVVVQGDAINRSRIATVVCVPLTSNLRLADAPGNRLTSLSRLCPSSRSSAEFAVLIQGAETAMAEGQAVVWSLQVDIRRTYDCSAVVFRLPVCGCAGKPSWKSRKGQTQCRK